LRIKVGLPVLVCFVLFGVATAYAAGIYGEYEGFPIVRVTVDGQEVSGDVPAINFYGRTLVPVRFVSEALGAEVDWDQATETALITTGTAPLFAGTDYTDWVLTLDEVNDAVWWGASAVGLYYSQFLPMYDVRFETGPTYVTLFTPWAEVAAWAQFDYEEYKELQVTYQNLMQRFSGKLRVDVFAWVSSPTAEASAFILREGYTYEPVTQSEPSVEPDDAEYTLLQDFTFDVSDMPKEGNLTVVVTVEGEQFIWTWDLGIIK